LYEGKNDVIVAFISSKIPTRPSSTEIVVERINKEFPYTGLKTPSVIKLDKVATIFKALIVGEIGFVGRELRKEISSKIVEMYKT
jgi:mRNA interferase MazF